jgi:hypothetical protein
MSGIKHKHPPGMGLVQPTSPRAQCTDCSFPTLFRSTFYLPQKASWQMQQVPEHQLSLLISTLRGQKFPMQQ